MCDTERNKNKTELGLPQLWLSAASRDASVERLQIWAHDLHKFWAQRETFGFARVPCEMSDHYDCWTALKVPANVSRRSLEGTITVDVKNFPHRSMKTSLLLFWFSFFRTQSLASYSPPRHSTDFQMRWDASRWDLPQFIKTKEERKQTIEENVHINFIYSKLRFLNFKCLIAARLIDKRKKLCLWKIEKFQIVPSCQIIIIKLRVIAGVSASLGFPRVRREHQWEGKLGEAQKFYISAKSKCGNSAPQLSAILS